MSDFLRILSILGDIFSVIGIPFLLWNIWRGYLLNAKLDGGNMVVPKDEVREAFRRAALAEASRLRGGRRVNFSKIEWKGRTLIIEEEKNG